MSRKSYPEKVPLSDVGKEPDKPPSGGYGFLGLVSFSTILPLNIHSTIPEMAKFTFIWPIIGAFIGIITGGFGWLLTHQLHLSPLLSAALIYSLAISFTGFHHLDGLVDFGDGLMAHGDPKRKIEIMRDKRIGTGGLAMLLMVSLVTVTSIASLNAVYILPAFFVSEVAAKLSLISCATFSEPLADGTGQYFIHNMDWKLLTGSVALTIILGFLAFNYTGIIGIVGGLTSGLLMVLITRRNFKQTNGDILGASNEIGRMLSLLFMIIFISWSV
ncbi:MULTISPECIES: adenosylcobinamide-GDP ribazoletransferase [Methanobacterium]|uniref:Adenosylcobinamide-GDP ribazoletransferase n=2 Tax=Methanobacterium subterraneum TaxID=59277 RepID=A0A2H4VQY8_9EURY|nr:MULTISPECIES: adenosylcobinamide-GDP ribazoletransferase [Methanobacterium]AUB57363.1 cobalamin 5'-phosphate synthase [Methanobacterium sp. MZ-A1]AUB60486.1 cobalamin 5'-phosphate synthase [Methanobacterium subterraneum]MBW4258265.1 adenosylcobinamide-GDP ribazoletransferase [Methanobacterium sp. YSL]NMO09897.1 adenosylcobinamide-GDP ribazoletransferase [Methanobacterium subterraneum]